MKQSKESLEREERTRQDSMTRHNERMQIYKEQKEEFHRLSEKINTLLINNKNDR